MSIYLDLREIINEAANELGADGSEFKSADIRDWIAQNRPEDWARFEPSFQGNYSYAVSSDSKCFVERVPGKFLYRLVKEGGVVPDDVPETENPPALSTVPVTVKHQREAKLYAALRDWLESRGYQAEVTASTKSGGTWGNPDVTGLRLDELPIGPAGFESTTIEAKLSVDGWKYYIFEAVAHKRFSHRAWFAFAMGTDSPSLTHIKDADVLAEYAEKYRVGILVVFIASQKYEQLTTGNATDLTLSTDDVRIEVLWPAVYEMVQIPALSEFMVSVLGISSQNDFGRFGR